MQTFLPFADFAESARSLISEFAPGVATGRTPPALPSWLGDEALHLSHRSNLVRKAPEYYRPLLPGVPDDLPYVWPGPDPTVSPDAASPAAAGASSSPTWILRPRDAREFEEWTRQGTVSLGALSPLGRRTPKWHAQLEAFAAVDFRGEVPRRAFPYPALLQDPLTVFLSSRLS